MKNQGIPEIYIKCLPATRQIVEENRKRMLSALETGIAEIQEKSKITIEWKKNEKMWNEFWKNNI